MVSFFKQHATRFSQIKAMIAEPKPTHNIKNGLWMSPRVILRGLFTANVQSQWLTGGKNCFRQYSIRPLWCISRILHLIVILNFLHILKNNKKIFCFCFENKLHFTENRFQWTPLGQNKCLIYFEEFLFSQVKATFSCQAVIFCYVEF